MFTAADIWRNTCSNQVLFLKFTTQTLTVLVHMHLESKLLPKKCLEQVASENTYYTGQNPSTTSTESKTKADEFQYYKLQRGISNQRHTGYLFFKKWDLEAQMSAFFKRLPIDFLLFIRQSSKY